MELDKRSAWQITIEYFNSKTKFTREQFLTHFKNVHVRKTTLDTYRMSLTAAGYLIWVDQGMYKRVKKIPKDANYKKCYEIYSEKMKKEREEKRKENEKLQTNKMKFIIKEG